MKLRQSQTLRNQRRNLRFTQWKQSQRLLHTPGVDLDDSYTLYTVEQGRQNVGFSNPLRSGSVRPLRTKHIPKMELGGEGDSKMEEKGCRNDVTEEREVTEKFRVIGRRRRSPTRGPDSRDPNWVQPTPVQTSADDTPVAQLPQLKQETQLRPNPSAATRDQKSSWPETRKPNPIPDAHSPAHLQTFPFSPGPIHHSRSTQTLDCNWKPARLTRQPSPRPETAAHASPSGCATCHVCSATPLGFVWGKIDHFKIVFHKFKLKINYVCEILTKVLNDPIGTNHQRKRRTYTRS